VTRQNPNQFTDLRAPAGLPDEASIEAEVLVRRTTIEGPGP